MGWGDWQRVDFWWLISIHKLSGIIITQKSHPWLYLVRVFPKRFNQERKTYLKWAALCHKLGSWMNKTFKREKMNWAPVFISLCSETMEHFPILRWLSQQLTSSPLVLHIIGPAGTHINHEWREEERSSWQKHALPMSERRIGGVNVNGSHGPAENITLVLPLPHLCTPFLIYPLSLPTKGDSFLFFIKKFFHKMYFEHVFSSPTSLPTQLCDAFLLSCSLTLFLKETKTKTKEARSNNNKNPTKTKLKKNRQNINETKKNPQRKQNKKVLKNTAESILC